MAAFSLRSQLDLTGRVALITGAANILGPEFAAALAEFGAHLALADIEAEACRRVAEEIVAAYGGECLAFATDVADEGSVRDLVTRVGERFGRIDILINGAATKTPGYFAPLRGYDLADWQRVLDVNLTGMFLSTKHVVPRLIEQGRGCIINIASIYGIVGPDPRLYEGSWYLDQEINTPAVYSATKAGVIGFTRHLATTLAVHGIRANAITPGGVFSGQNDTFAERYGARTPLGRMARRDELRGAVLFLASDASSYITGHNLVVDGGWSAW